MHRLPFVWLASLAVFAFASMAAIGSRSAPAQQASVQLAQFPAPSAPKKRSYTDKGIISAVSPKGLSVIAKKEVWVLYPQPNCKVYITGQAERDYLKSGMLVRLYGQFDKRLKASDPIARLDIVSRSTPNLAFGVFVDTLPPEEEVARAQAAAEAAANGDPADPGPCPAAGDPQMNAAGGAADPADPNSNPGAPSGDNPNDPADLVDPADPGASGPDSEFKPTMVVGQLKLIKDNELVVSAGGRTVRVSLADDAEIRVFLADFTLASRGDPVKFRSEYFEKGTAYPTELTIELTRPLAAPKKQARSAPVRPAAKH